MKQEQKWNDFCYNFGAIGWPMKKHIPFSLLILLWAVSASGGDLPPFSEHANAMNFFVAENYGEPEKDIEIYPNPVTEGRITIKASESILLVQILNITGKMVFNQEYEPNTFTVVIDLDKLEKGIYLVRIGFTGDLTHTEKIMIK